MSEPSAVASVLSCMGLDQSEFPIVIELTDGGRAIIARKVIENEFGLIKTKYTFWDMKGDS